MEHKVIRGRDDDTSPAGNSPPVFLSLFWPLCHLPRKQHCSCQHPLSELERALKFLLREAEHHGRLGVKLLPLEHVDQAGLRGEQRQQG